MLEIMQKSLWDVKKREVQRREAVAKVRAEIEAGSTRITAGPGWTPEQEVKRGEHKKAAPTASKPDTFADQIPTFWYKFVSNMIYPTQQPRRSSRILVCFHQGIIRL